jgi:uroporphyrinogen-III synthase
VGAAPDDAGGPALEPTAAPNALRVIVTRPAAQAQPWVEALRARGVDAVVLPLIEIAPAPDPSAVHRAWHALSGCAFVMFVSANAVEGFFALRPPGLVWPPALEAGCTGPGTARVLRAALAAAGAAQAGVVEPEPGEALESESLWRRLAGRDWPGRRVFVVRGGQGRDWLAAQWQGAGAQADFVAAYARRAPVPDAAGQAVLRAALAAPTRHAWYFGSAEAVAHLGALAPGADWSGAVALASHPRIAQAAQAAGFLRVHPVGAGWQGLAEAVARLESGPL